MRLSRRCAENLLVWQLLVGTGLPLVGFTMTRDWRDRFRVHDAQSSVTSISLGSAAGTDLLTCRSKFSDCSLLAYCVDKALNPHRKVLAELPSFNSAHVRPVQSLRTPKSLVGRPSLSLGPIQCKEAGTT